MEFYFWDYCLDAVFVGGNSGGLFLVESEYAKTNFA
jgi:hypothetical protein